MSTTYNRRRRRCRRCLHRRRCRRRRRLRLRLRRLRRWGPPQFGLLQKKVCVALDVLIKSKSWKPSSHNKWTLAWKCGPQSLLCAN